MSFETIFMFELLLAAVVVTVILGGVIYLAIRNRRTRHDTGREVGKADGSFGTAPEETTEDTVGRAPREPRREFYKSMGLDVSVLEYKNPASAPVTL